MLHSREHVRDPRAVSRAGGDRLRGREDLARRVDVEVLDEPAVQGRDALALRLRGLEGRDDGPRVLDLGRTRTEDLVRDLHLTRVDQRLAVETELTALLRLGAEALVVLDVVVDPVDDRNPAGARPERDQLQAGLDGAATGAVLGPSSL